MWAVMWFVTNGDPEASQSREPNENLKIWRQKKVKEKAQLKGAVKECEKSDSPSERFRDKEIHQFLDLIPEAHLEGYLQTQENSSSTLQHDEQLDYTALSIHVTGTAYNRTNLSGETPEDDHPKSCDEETLNKIPEGRLKTFIPPRGVQSFAL
jgi:hypothetical protein